MRHGNEVVGNSSAEPGAARPSPKVLIPCDYYPPAARAGGAAVSLAAIVAQESGRARIRIVTRNTDLGLDRKFLPAETEAVDGPLPEVAVARCSSRNDWVTILQSLRTRPDSIDIIYLNSLFSPRYSLWPLLLMATRLVRRRRILLAPRGELGTGALSIKHRRKWVVSRLLRRAMRNMDVTWHASSVEEAGTITSFLAGLEQAVFIRSDPAASPQTPSAPDNSTLVITFLARMVPQKNFELVVRASAELRVPATVVVAGALEDVGYWRRCAALIDDLPAHITIERLGHLGRPEVNELLRRTDIMVLPTRGENFGHAIAEALSVGCPVVVSDRTPWTELITDGCGWVVDTDDPGPMRDALERLAGLSCEDRIIARRAIAARYAQWWSATQVHQESLFLAAFDGGSAVERGGCPASS